MRYEGKLYRPPSEANSYIVQATIGCSWNHCTYCDMYRDKSFRVRELDETLEDLHAAAATYGDGLRKVFVADGDALILDMDHWEPILETCAELFPKLSIREPMSRFSPNDYVLRLTGQERQIPEPVKK